MYGHNVLPFKLPVLITSALQSVLLISPSIFEYVVISGLYHTQGVFASFTLTQFNFPLQRPLGLRVRMLVSKMRCGALIS